jgi:hypothetical protein
VGSDKVVSYKIFPEQRIVRIYKPYFAAELSFDELDELCSAKARMNCDAVDMENCDTCDNSLCSVKLFMDQTVLE